MADLMTLTCPSCGGQLQITNETDRFVCAHCGNSHVVDPGQRVESLVGELEQMRLKMDIRQAEDSLAVLRKHQAALEDSTSPQTDSQLWWKILNIGLPVGVVFIGVTEGANILFSLFLAALLGAFLLLINWAFSSNNNKRELSELRRVTARIESGDRTLNFLKQELQRVTNEQHALRKN